MKKFLFVFVLSLLMINCGKAQNEKIIGTWNCAGGGDWKRITFNSTGFCSVGSDSIEWEMNKKAPYKLKIMLGKEANESFDAIVSFPDEISMVWKVENRKMNWTRIPEEIEEYSGPQSKEINEVVEKSLQELVILKDGKLEEIEKFKIIKVKEDEESDSWFVRVFAEGNVMLQDWGRYHFSGEVEYEIRKDSTGKFIANQKSWRKYQ